MKEKNLKNVAKPSFAFGNWWHPESYSEVARREKQAADGVYDSGDDYLVADPNHEAMRTRVGIANYYKGRRTSSVANLLFILANDVFCLPLEVRRSMREETALLAPFDADLFYALQELGQCGILYVTKSNSENQALDSAARIGRHLYLTDDKVGMPVADYLFYMLGNQPAKPFGGSYGRVSARTLTEWTGIPVQRQEFVYDKLVELLRMCVEAIHQHQIKYNMQPMAATTGQKTSDEVPETSTYDQYPFNFDPDAEDDA